MAIIAHRGFTFRTAVDADWDQTTAEVMLAAEPSPGVAFARLLHAQHRSNPEKDRARAMVARYYLDKAWPGPLKILTMPGLRWPFERMLLGARISGMWNGLAPDARTSITAFEKDAAVYRGGLAKIPGLRYAPVQIIGARCIRTFLVDRYVFGNIEDELLSGEPYDAAWLDWTGPITARRMEAVQQFWDSACRHSLTMTVMDARQSGGANTAIRQYGSVAAWADARLVDGHAVYVHRYVGQGGVPMVQIMRAKDAAPGV